MPRINKVIKRLITTEKSIKAKEGQNKYVFEVHQEASQGLISKEVALHYKVEVENVNVLVMPGKKRRFNRKNIFKRTPKWKKAIVELKEGHKIEETKKDKEEKKGESK